MSFSVNYLITYNGHTKWSQPKIKNMRKFQTINTKSRWSRPVAYESCRLLSVTQNFTSILFWKSGRLLKMVAQGGSSVSNRIKK